VLGYSWLFYEAQQTGQLPGWNRLLYGTSSSEYGTGWKKNAHLADGTDVQKDLSGGWYDAGGERHASFAIAIGDCSLHALVERAYMQDTV
jgi:hypothetical protein